MASEKFLAKTRFVKLQLQFAITANIGASCSNYTACVTTLLSRPLATVMITIISSSTDVLRSTSIKKWCSGGWVEWAAAAAAELTGIYRRAMNWMRASVGWWEGKRSASSLQQLQYQRLQRQAIGLTACIGVPSRPNLVHHFKRPAGKELISEGTERERQKDRQKDRLREIELSSTYIK